MVYIVDWGVIRENFKERENGSPTMSRRAVDLEISSLGEIRIYHQSAVAAVSGMK